MLQRRRPMLMPPPPPQAVDEQSQPGQPAINPALARVGAGYAPDPEEDQDQYDEQDTPNRMAVRAAMSGGQPMPGRGAMMAQEAGESPQDELAESPAYQDRERRMGVEKHLGSMARHRKHFSPHKRARSMKIHGV